MPVNPGTSVFVLGTDYHLGDLLWFTAVLAEYRRQRRPERVIVAVPDRPIDRILEHSPLIDELVPHGSVPANHGGLVRYHDLRPFPIARAMLRDWRHRLPWLYYRDLWLEPRGQWLATFLHLGSMSSFRPVIGLVENDRGIARSLPKSYAVLAPHIGTYRLPLASRFWRRIKGWNLERWTALAGQLRRVGYEPVTLAAAGQDPIPGTRPLLGQPIRQVAGIIESASVLITGESGLWFVAAAVSTPFIIVPWWLPRSVDWPGPMGVPHRRIFRDDASVRAVLAQFREMVA